MNKWICTLHEEGICNGGQHGLRPFTDDDLKELKEDIDSLKTKTVYQLRTVKLHALIARLEASELSRSTHASIYAHDCDCGQCRAWRKAAGRQ